MAEALLRIGAGGVVLTAKSSETELWKRYCHRTGRSRDLVLFGPGHRWQFNALDYELQRPGRGAGQTQNMIRLLTTLAETSSRNTGGRNVREGEGFFRQATEQMSGAMIDLLALSEGCIRIEDMYELLMSAPKAEAQLKSADWKAQSFCVQSIVKADRQAQTGAERKTFERVMGYWMGVYPHIPETTRGGIDITFIAMFDALNRGWAQSLFGEGTNITPQAAENGKIIVVDMPIHEFGDGGLYGQILWKYAFQRSIEQRDVRMSPRPVFLWADEAQYFLTPQLDMEFLSTCRGYRAATVFLTQGISNVYAALPGKGAEADAILNNLVAKIFHNNGSATNTWAAELIGRTRQYSVNASSSFPPTDWVDRWLGYGYEPQVSAGVSESYEYEVQPREFTKLRTGGRKNKWNVDGIVFQPGQVFSDTGTSWRHATFRQKV